MRALHLLLAVMLLAAAASHSAAKDEAKPEPRKTSKADQRKLDKERKELLKARDQRAKTNAKANAALGKKLEALMEGWKDKGFSGAILVAKDGQPLIKKGYGMADREAKRANAPDTLYDIGSVTKLFTAAGVLRLEQDGKLRLSDTLGRFFSFAPADKKEITVEQLLSHTGGLSRMYEDQHIDVLSRDKTVRGLLSIPLSAKPGERFEYSNTNYYLAGAIIEVVSGESYESYMQRQILEPAGMKDSAFCSSERLDDKRSAMRYEDNQNRGSVSDWPFTWGQRGCGYLVSTVEDMWKFSEAVDFGDSLDAQAKQHWFKVRQDDYALGWLCKEVEGLRMQYHGGAAPGARAYLARFPDKDAMYVFFFNVSEQGKAPEFQLAADIEALLRAAE